MYFDPYMQKAMLLDDEDPNALLDATGAPVSASPAPQYPSPMMPGMAPTGPLGLSQGLQPVDPELQRKANIMGMFSNINQVAGGRGLDNPFQNQIDLNQKMQMERLTQMRAGSQDPIVRGVQQYAAAAGLTHLPWNEQVAAYREAKQSMYADRDTRTAQEKNADFLLNATPEEREAYFADRGIETKTLEDGSLVAIDEQGNTEVLFDAKTQQLGAEALESSKTRGQRVQEQVQEDMLRLRTIEESSFELDQAVTSMNGWMEKLKAMKDSGNDTGLVSGFLKEFGIMGDETDGEMMAAQIETALTNLGIVNLAPVTDKEMEEIKKLFIGLKRPTDVNIGALKASLDRIYRKLDSADFKAQQSRDYILEHGDDRDKAYVNKFFPKPVSREDALKNTGGQ